MRWLGLLWSFLVLLPLYGEDEIVVRLTTAPSLTPIQITPSGSLYQQQLTKILAFDLNHNGQTRATKKASLRAELEIHDHTLQLTLHNDPLKKVQKMAPITLSGNLSEDRQKIHLAADSLHQALFHTPGIASTRVLYSKRIKHGTSSDSWISEIWESDYDGANSHQITHDHNLCVTPIYLPTPTQAHPRALLYTSYKRGQPKIYGASLKEGRGTRLSPLKGNQLMPALSHQNDQIAFICDATGNPDLFIQAFSPEKGVLGNPRLLFRAKQAAQGSPCFSPDGNQVAFVSNKDGTARIYTIDTRKRVAPVLISRKNRSNTAPAWSPDGTKLAYCAKVQGVRQIWIYDLTSREEYQLTEGLTHKENPCWAPNSLHLIYNSESPYASQLYLINLNQKKAIQITRGPEEKRFPYWESKLLPRNHPDA